MRLAEVLEKIMRNRDLIDELPSEEDRLLAKLALKKLPEVVEA